MNRNKLNLGQIAVLGLYVDDPYGDGIRLERVREPNKGRQAAQAMLRGDVFDPIVVREEYEEKVLAAPIWKRDGSLKEIVEINLVRW